jgi:23S rRNA (adenine2030-N6)-methyltransferase
VNYRHAYHAGNFADVLKHVVLARILGYLGTKETPFRYVDAHGGIGLYDLASDEAERGGEWGDGVGRLFADGRLDRPVPVDGDAEALIAPWRAAVAAVNPDGALRHYPGSPEIARHCLRADDRMILNELHPQDRALLARRFARDARAKVLSLDAYQALRMLLPPPERRGLVLIDPPFEAANEAERMVSGLAAAYRRFATGCYLLWYPVKNQPQADRLAAALGGLGLPKMLRAEVTVRPVDGQTRLRGSGLVIVNPPYTLEEELRVLLPTLAERLGQGEAAWRVEALAGELRAGAPAERSYALAASPA